MHLSIKNFPVIECIDFPMNPLGLPLLIYIYIYIFYFT